MSTVSVYITVVSLRVQSSSPLAALCGPQLEELLITYCQDLMARPWLSELSSCEDAGQSGAPSLLHLAALLGYSRSVQRQVCWAAAGQGMSAGLQQVRAGLLGWGRSGQVCWAAAGQGRSAGLQQVRAGLLGCGRSGQVCWAAAGQGRSAGLR